MFNNSYKQLTVGFNTLSIMLILLSSVVLVKANTFAEQLPKDNDDHQSVIVPLLTLPPVIDGELDDPIWQHAVRLTKFYQTRPGDNIEPAQPTAVFLGYDSQKLYIGIQATDEKGQVRAAVVKRDEITNDDYVSIYLDTFNDRQKAYVLAFNPLGIQQDGIYTEGAGVDYSFDFLMESEGKLNENGYTIEAAIPFSSLRYNPGAAQNWGVHIVRHLKHNNDEEDSLMPLIRGNSSFLGQAGHIKGLDQIAEAREIEVIPSLNALQRGRRVRTFIPANNQERVLSLGPGRFASQNLAANLGLTTKLKITSSMTLDATVNPDFAQIEADQLVVTANQRFPIFFTEKRPFFLEGSEIFQTPLKTVYTRSIIDPDWAVKLSGQQDRSSYAALLASDNAPGNFSDDELSDPAFRSSVKQLIDKNALVAIFRAKRDLGRQSNLGLVATSYKFVEKNNQLFGVDGHFSLNAHTNLNFQILGTHSKQLFYNPEQNLNVYRSGSGTGYYLQLQHTDRHFNWTATASGRSPDYRAAAGFTSQTNINNWNLFVRYDSESNPQAGLVSWSASNTFLANFDWQGRPKYAYVNPSVALNFQKQTFLNLTIYSDYSKLLEDEFGASRNQNQPGAFFGAPQRSTIYPGFTIELGTAPSKKYSASISFDRTWNAFDYDFGAGPRFPRVSPAALLDPNAALDPGLGRTLDLAANFTWRPSDKLNLSLDYLKSKLLRTDTHRIAFNDDLPSLKATYQFSRSTFARLRTDYDSLQSNFRGQFLIGWTPHPGTAFYAGYNDDLNYNGFNPFTQLYEPRWRRNERQFFLKFSYLWRHSI